MADLVVNEEGHVVITDGDETLTYTGLEVRTPDGSVISHESRGGSMFSAATTSVGDTFVEISHLGDGPDGGELVMVATAPDGSTCVALGGLVRETIGEHVPESWLAAVDLAIGLVTEGTIDSGTKEDVEAFHQRLLGAYFG